MNNSKYYRKIFLLLGSAAILRFIFLPLIENEDISNIIKFPIILFVLIFGAFYVLKGSADIIEETTDILSHKTKLAGGLLQSIGTAFPDMILGIIAALVSLNLRESNYDLAINYAIIAATTTFGSNIYNVGYATWCLFRQNLANTKKKTIRLFPYLNTGFVKPIGEHARKPTFDELDNGINIMVLLSMITAFVAFSMVVFGKVLKVPSGTNEDLFQLVLPVGVIVFLLCVLIMFAFRKAKKPEGGFEEVKEGEDFFSRKSILFILGFLVLSGIAIMFSAETMVHAIVKFCEITNIPFAIAGVLAGLIGCLGEILVVHSYTVKGTGRIGDAVVGVAMDNVVTIMGAAIVAIMGGIFLGGNS